LLNLFNRTIAALLLKCLNEGIIFGFLVQAKIQTKKKNSIQTGPKIIENQMDVIIICVLIGWKGGRGATIPSRHGNNNALQQQFNCNSFCNHQYVVQLNFPLPGSSFFLLLCCKKKNIELFQQ